MRTPTSTDLRDEILLRFILQKFDQLVTLVGSLEEADAGRDLGEHTGPEVSTNSAVQLLVHVCGVMRRWSSSVNLGVPVPRDRDGEFTTQMPAAQALELAARAREAFLDDIAATDWSAAPAALPAGRDEQWTVTCHGVLLHVFEEICQHLGHAEITRDVVTARRPSLPPEPAR
ncbi:DUF664 domain-containing protein [Nesterenkonia sp. CL21]|uniref:mycothiol transferase n=1 Tax=Nesterenkonia sp. CL21 TaxID=3064894 RepID=UPI0028788B3A|nr:DUF664 domain-containing protein [Nesterenkonia sp. CL21]MDS2171187.1 DUF664 domain-containing protein [Nesterenkonia sp. CL21]